MFPFYYFMFLVKKLCVATILNLCPVSFRYEIKYVLDYFHHIQFVYVPPALKMAYKPTLFKNMSVN